MRNKAILFLLLLVLSFNFIGCASARKSSDLEVQGLRNQVAALETQLQAKDDEINRLRETGERIATTSAPVETSMKAVTGKKKRIIPEVKSHPNTKQVQQALKNAGFDPGNIDGKMGKQSREALKSFQKAHNLKVDGKAGKETWELLKDYLYKQVK